MKFFNGKDKWIVIIALALASATVGFAWWQTPALESFEVRAHIVSAAATQVQQVFDMRMAHNSLSIQTACSAGTAALTVEGSPDNTNFIQADSITAAQFIVKVYGPSTAGAATPAATAGPIAPLSFRFVRITLASCGASNTGTLNVAAT